MTVAVLGAGAWGTAIASILSSRVEVALWARDAAQAESISRTRYNERGDFLITTTPAINEATAPSSAALVFPHIVNISGYTMEFILFSGTQDGGGAVFFFDESGEPVTMTDQ